MNATPLLSNLLAALAKAKLEVVLIGNAAAAIQGAPVTTIDFDFMFRDTPTNLRKIKKAADRDRDRAVIPVLEQTLRAIRKQ